jgi:hypothetical protein
MATGFGSGVAPSSKNDALLQEPHCPCARVHRLAKQLSQDAAGSLAMLLRDARRKRKYVVMRA